MPPSRTRTLHAWALCAVALAAGPCRAATPGDPFEGFNRRMFGVEEVLDRHLFGPVSHGYASAPSPIRTALRNWAKNINEPVVFANDMLQGHVGTAAGTLARFVMNSTFGIAGFLDVAKKNHLPRHENTFGTTLGRWGVAPGPYLFLPLVGPTTVRDGVGSLADIGLDPMTYTRFEGRTEIAISATVINGLSDRIEGSEDLARIRETSTDPYATLRSYYLQNRKAEITGQSVDIETLPDFDTTPSPATPPATPPAATPPPPSPPETPAGPTASAATDDPAADPASDSASADAAAFPDDEGGQDPSE